MADRTLLTPPMTIYAVALTYARGVNYVACATMLLVSGIDPLTAEEVYARAHADIAGHWDTNRLGPLTAWSLGDKAYLFRTITSGAGG